MTAMEVDASSGSDSDQSRSSSVDVQLQLVPNHRSSGSNAQLPRKMTAPEQTGAFKAARKSTGPSRSTHERSLTVKRKQPRRASPSQTIDGGSPHSLIKPEAAPRSATFRIEELPFPFSLDIELKSVHPATMPYPCFATHQFSLALRHDCQSTLQATSLGAPATISQWLDSADDLTTGLARTTFILLEYPPLPLAQSLGTVPQRSEVLLRYSISSSTGEILFETTVPISRERRIERSGEAKSKRSSNGGFATFGWKLHTTHEDGQTAQEPTTETVEQLENRLELRLRSFEKEWREEVVEREQIAQSLVLDSQQSSQRDLPTGFQRTPSLIPGLDGAPIKNASSLPPFLPIPKYEFVQYSTRAIPVTGRPFEAFPHLDGWEDSESTNRFVDEQSCDRMTYEPGPGDDEAKVMDENAWNRANLVSRKTLEGLNPGRVGRDFAALDSLFEDLNLDRQELAKRLNKSCDDPGKWSKVLQEEPLVAQLCRSFEERLGISLEEVQQNSRLRSEKEVVMTENLIDLCEFCGDTLCSVHPSLFSYNTQLPQTRAPRARSPSESLCPTCKEEGCRSREIVSSPASMAKEEQLRQFVKDFPNLNPCTVSIILERNLNEVMGSVSAPDPKPKARPTIRASKPSPALAKWIAQQSDGYAPCDCTLSCGQGCNCRQSRSFCDRFCGCPPECTLRFRGCDCHASAEAAGPGHRCCILKRDNECSCRIAGRACDPRLCAPCDRCNNMQVQRVEPKATIFTVSSVPNGGYGLVALENIQPGQLVGPYSGESFTTETNSWDSTGYGAWKASWSEKARISFWFNLDQEHSIDSQEIGNLMRFTNHRRQPDDNCGASVTYVDGAHQIALAATETIKAGGELFIDYGEEYKAEFQN